ncbi:hypothetical protein [Actinoplanes philippinensis]
MRFRWGTVAVAALLAVAAAAGDGAPVNDGTSTSDRPVSSRPTCGNG